jgi:polysaccharide deacetylase 2 family uncharacterized protein YibQ
MKKYFFPLAAGAIVSLFFAAALFMFFQRTGSRMEPPSKAVPCVTRETPSLGTESGAIPSPGTVACRIALVIDDCGYSMKHMELLDAIDAPVTLAVLPGAPYAKKVSDLARKTGKEVIVHLPMEPETLTSGLEEDTITVDMDEGSIGETVARAFAAGPGATGVSSHMGSRATADTRVMGVVFDQVRDKDMFFLDSLTCGSSVCRELAGKKGIRFAERDVFIDNVPENGAILGELERAVRVGKEHGTAVVIGHYRETTLKTLAEAVPRMKEEGVEFVTLSALMDRTE